MNGSSSCNDNWGQFVDFEDDVDKGVDSQPPTAHHQQETNTFALLTIPGATLQLSELQNQLDHTVSVASLLSDISCLSIDTANHSIQSEDMMFSLDMDFMNTIDDPTIFHHGFS
eukprot:CAMPEP_0194674638 /NCGR_PEP_ID=MMETSP0295-20121207/7777_1 /TAXON_ID=39354 /ORGANISM="Heterosigma akashiwo, Strain CCMP2393" /LENGTH=113 /DNA_ID=CAMNT_0039558811 /DNA_START=40 /DNA_END=381 /DNA_ORIENTATION=+